MEAGPAGFERVVLEEPASSGNGMMRWRMYTMSSSREYTSLSLSLPPSLHPFLPLLLPPSLPPSLPSFIPYSTLPSSLMALILALIFLAPQAACLMALSEVTTCCRRMAASLLCLLLRVERRQWASGRRYVHTHVHKCTCVIFLLFPLSPPFPPHLSQLIRASCISFFFCPFFCSSHSETVGLGLIPIPPISSRIILLSALACCSC